MEYLFFCVTHNGVRPKSKKMDIIVNMQPPNDKLKVRTFIILINNFRDMWNIPTHMIHPLTRLS